MPAEAPADLLGTTQTVRAMPLPHTADAGRPAPPLLERLDEGLWRASDHARGPFAGVQGGIVAALMATEIEAVAPAAFRPLAVRADLLKPVPPDVPLRIRVAPVQAGRRIAVFDATLEAAGQLKARCALTLASEVAVPGLATDHESHPAAAPAIDPMDLPPRSVRAPEGGAWLMDVLQPRLAPDGSVWFRWQAPMLPGVSAFTAALPPADFAHGLARAGLPGPAPVAGFPNPDLTVHFARPPQGPWIGVRPAARWQRSGLGLRHGDLLDRGGAFGRVAMGVVLIP
ncbi:acyl-CoA thioesterase domain-containing protein [Paracraurococcus ruber]|uniref:Acyl-CoA thioesterase-like N-terminal HotDog domain-containing protein n=1 Tax=Paracraurococcus ruber TaxID=77675 RepID=A0ABS1CZB5_9PROT|nr:acyl-CoA thioesterase domain-containing protein [Paracraurococcus ruber]MBK1659873.1 hypothetical protein [Paracraurococcus ruber]TDG28183.1 hypothetical protein E2C05_21160 [Paracraurococcus ruber]